MQGSAKMTAWKAHVCQNTKKESCNLIIGTRQNNEIKVLTNLVIQVSAVAFSPTWPTFYTFVFIPLYYILHYQANKTRKVSRSHHVYPNQQILLKYI